MPEYDFILCAYDGTYYAGTERNHSRWTRDESKARRFSESVAQSLLESLENKVGGKNPVTIRPVERAS